MVNGTPLQLTVVRLPITAVGLIVTVTVKVVPTQIPVNGVTIYVAVCVVFNGFVNIPLMFVCAVSLNPPAKPPNTLGALQLYNVPAGTIPFVLFVGVILNPTPLQLTVVIAVITGVGLIVTVTVNAAPVQFPVTGVTIYVAICAMFVGFVKLPLMLIAFVALIPPVSPPVTPGILQL